MVLERTIVDRVKGRPAFCQMFPSTEITPSPLAPALSPTILHKGVTHGTVTKPAVIAARAARTVLHPEA
jgi:hypothetical protein